MSEPILSIQTVEIFPEISDQPQLIDLTDARNPLVKSVLNQKPFKLN